MSLPTALPAAAVPPSAERKSMAVDCKAVGDDAGELEFYAAVFNNIDRDGDVILPNAFANLDEFLRDGFSAFDHRWGDIPVAYPAAAAQDAKGLKVLIKFHSTPKAQELRTVVAERLKAGKSVKCSVGYKILDAVMELRDGKPVRVIKSLMILEAGVVNIPANPAAEATSVKSLASLDQLSAWLDGVKKGKTLSTANHGKLNEWAKGLHAHGKAACAMAKDVVSWLKSIEPATEDLDDDGDADDDADGKSARLSALKARAVRGRASAACP